MTKKQKRTPIVLMMLIGFVFLPFHIYRLISSPEVEQLLPQWAQIGTIIGLALMLVAGLLIFLWKKVGFYLLPVAIVIGTIPYVLGSGQYVGILNLMISLAVYSFLWIKKEDAIDWKSYS